MPHKVNPIDFENSEGTWAWPMRCSSISQLSSRFPTATRPHRFNGVAQRRRSLRAFLIAFKSLLRGLDKLLVNEAALKADLENNWAVVAEAIQTVLRREG